MNEPINQRRLEGLANSAHEPLVRQLAKQLLNAERQLAELRKQESVPKGFIVVSKDLLVEAIACNTDASLAEARHIINSVLKVSDDEIFRETLREQTK